MRLPSINYTQVQPLGRDNPRAAGAAAAGPYDLASGIIDKTEEMADYTIMLNEQKLSAEMGNKTMQVSDQLANTIAGDFVNIDDPFIPDGVRREAIARLKDDPNAANYQNDAGSYNIPTHYVAQGLTKHYTNVIQTEVNKIGTNREREMYQDYVKNTVSDNLQKSQASVVRADISAGRDYRVIHQDNLISQGRLSEALDVSDEAYQSGYYSKEFKEEQDKVLYDKARILFDDQAMTLTERYETEIASGKTQEALLTKAEFEASIMDAKQWGDKLKTNPELREMQRQFDLAGDKQANENKLLEAYQTGGYPAAQQLLTSWQLMKETPENFSREEYENFTRGELQTTLNIIKNSQNAGAKAAVDDVNGFIGASRLQTLRSQGSAIVGDKQAEKASDTEFDYTWNMAHINGASDEQLQNIVYRFVAMDKRIPSGLNTYFEKAILSTDPEEIEFAGQILNVLQTQPDTKAVAAYVSIPKNQAFLLEAANAIRNRGDDADPFLETMRDNYFRPNSKEEMQVNLNRYKDQLTVDKMQGSFEKAVSNKWGAEWYQIFKADPYGTAEAEAAFNWNVKELVKGGADIEVAYEVAENELRSNFDVTYSDASYPDGKLMRNAPDGEGSWVKPQFDRYKSQHFGDLDPERIFLVSGGLTNQESKKSYAVMYRPNPDDPTTAVQLVDKRTGLLERWETNFRKTDDYKTMVEKQKNDSKSLDAPIQLTNSVREKTGDAFKAEFESRKQRGTPIYYNLADSMVMDDVLKEAIKKLDSDQNLVGYRINRRTGGKIKYIKDQPAYDAAVNQLELAAKQARTAAYESTGKKDMLAPYQQTEEPKPKRNDWSRKSQRKSNEIPLR